MRFLILLFLGLLIIGCKTQDIIKVEASLNDQFEPGKCYHAIQFDDPKQSLKQQAFILEAIPPQYKEVVKTYAVDTLNEQFSEAAYFQFLTQKVHLKFEIRNEQLSNFISQKDPRGYLFCLLEVPSHYKTIQKNTINTKEIQITERQIIAESKIIKTYVKRKPKKLKENQYYFESGNWSDLREAISATRCPVVPLVSKIKTKLNELGYKLTVNEVMDEATKNALIDFQRKNNLAEGQLDFATLKKLDIHY